MLLFSIEPRRRWEKKKVSGGQRARDTSAVAVKSAIFRTKRHGRALKKKKEEKKCILYNDQLSTDYVGHIIDRNR